MTKRFYNGLKVGILGGGQLGQMLIQEAIALNVDISILDPDSEAPCKAIAHHFTVGSLSDYDTVYRFGKTVDILTIEIEKVNVDALEQLEKEGVKVYPQPSVIRTIQDKGLQKQFFADHGIPTAPFQLIETNGLTDALNKGIVQIPFVNKSRRDGYDGRGVCLVRSESDLEKAFTVPAIVEELIPFEKELSVIVARSASGEVKAFPPVEMDFHPTANLVEFQVSPARVDAQTATTAAAIAQQVAEQLQIVGILAVEMFLTKDGLILVNEVAPRPHNSGHQSIEGNVTSQFQQHLRAVLDMPLGSTKPKGTAVMVNLLGAEGHEGPADYSGLDEALAMEGVNLHLYGKKLTKPYRKMGHITVIGEEKQAIETARKVKELVKVVTLK